MSNMSYCRYHNTLIDLRDCADHIHDDNTDLAISEVAARKKLIELCEMIVEEVRYYES